MRRLATQRHPDVAHDIVDGSIYDIPIEDSEYDYVISIEVVRYLEDFPRAASEVARILRPGGRWLFTATPPTNWSLGPILNRLRCAGIPLPGLQKLRMFWHSARYLRGELNDVGLSIAALAPLYYVDLTAMALKDTVPSASSAWMRLWHPVWKILERSRCAAWAAGYYFVVAEVGETGGGGD
jgi:SAM-dependent methyltransferase